MYDLIFILFVQKSLIDGIYNALISFCEVRIYLEEKERERANRVIKQNKKHKQWRIKCYFLIHLSVVFTTLENHQFK